MAKTKIQFIVNPFSGVSQKENLAKLLEKELDFQIFDTDLHYTESPGHATEIAKKAVSESIDIVVAVGGDGTVNEVGKALTGSKSCLGILPGGSGNGFATHLGIPRNLRKAIRCLNSGKIIHVDTCRANGEFFLNVAGVGFNAKVAYNTKLQRSRGFSAYFKEAFKSAILYKNCTYEVISPDFRQSGKFLALEIANASFFGYNFAVAPQAKLNDGVLDVVMIKNTFKLRYILSLWRFFAHNVDKSSIADMRSATEVTISSPKPMYVHLDGEGKMTESPIRFSIVPKSLMVWAPGT